MFTMMMEALSTFLLRSAQYFLQNTSSNSQLATIPAQYVYHVPLFLISASSTSTTMAWNETLMMVNHVNNEKDQESTYHESTWVLWAEDFVKFLVFTSVYRLGYSLGWRLLRELVKGCKRLRNWLSDKLLRLRQNEPDVSVHLVANQEVQEEILQNLGLDNPPSESPTVKSKETVVPSTVCETQQSPFDPQRLTKMRDRLRASMRKTSNDDPQPTVKPLLQKHRQKLPTLPSTANAEPSSVSPDTRAEVPPQEEIHNPPNDPPSKQITDHQTSSPPQPKATPFQNIRALFSNDGNTNSVKNSKRVVFRIQLGGKQFQEVADWTDGPDEIAIRWTKRRPKKRSMDTTSASVQTTKRPRTLSS